jgi:pimeloyl-ACP methyl ester carboxylesterase
MRNIFIHGIETLLGSSFAAQFLQNLNHRVLFSSVATRRQVGELVAHAARQINHDQNDSERQKPGDRLQRVGTDGGNCVAAVWWFANAREKADDTEILDRLLVFCSGSGAKELNYIAFDFAGEEAAHIIADQEIARRCAAQHVQYRVFLVSSVVGIGHPDAKYTEILPQFLSRMFSLKAEIEERSPKYFDFQSLRWLAPDDAAVNLMPVTVAVDALLRVAGTEGTTNNTFRIFSPNNIPVWMLCESIGIAYSLSLLPVKDGKALNAIDRVFHERGVGLEGALVSGMLEKPAEVSSTKYLPDGVPLDEEAQIGVFQSIQRIQDEALTMRNRRARELPNRLERKTIEKNGLELSYYAGGTKGTPIIVLNALGQGLEYWYRLLDHLIESHRIIIWEPRGTMAPPPPFGVPEQVDDLADVVKHEGIESCHLVGWCTGPKIAIEFAVRQPSVVLAMAFLNTSLKCDEGPRELDSAYEHNMESLCRMLVRKPAMAASVMNTLRSQTESNETEMLEGNDSEETSVSVLSLRNINLKCHVLAPFKTEVTTANYAHQLVDFWKSDVRAKASEIKAPVLLISAEYDQVATPESSMEAAKLFANARHVHVKGATHYCLYDRPELVADLLKTFFANSVDVSAPTSKQDKMLHSAGTQALEPETVNSASFSSRVAYGS